jgi:hypothetical protein
MHASARPWPLSCGTFACLSLRAFPLPITFEHVFGVRGCTLRLTLFYTARLVRGVMSLLGECMGPKTLGPPTHRSHPAKIP